MHIKTHLILVIVFVVLFSLFLAACAKQPAASNPPAAATSQPGATTIDAQALLNEKCTQCHNLDRVKSKHLTQDQWNQVVTRMVGKGTKLNADEQQALVEYLAQTYGQ